MSKDNLQSVLAGKRVVVVGASSGMGLAVAKASAAQGAHVIMCSRSLEQVSEELPFVADRQKNSRAR